MRTKLAILSLLLVFAMGIPCALANKIGIVDVQKIMETSKMGMDYSSQLKTETEKKTADLEARQTSLNNLKQQLESQAKFLKDEVKEEKMRQLRIESGDFQVLQKKYLDELKQLEYTLTTGLHKAILDVVDEIAKKEQYTLIIERQEGGVMFNLDGMNITDQVIKEINARHKK
ncbi:periplasmic chaperone for outer membrane proteins Skp [Desulfatibacillum alkenivorans DSM 16219]|jgi:outer membrane protein|uniref:Periplasmic chaperone for outer membrane proteins Skp n=1 Tax=Desulfatibacillum alkenivorans DSM 16219 TaxID=1121393 RepID=A0A1M6CLN7_9BACT|nr:OmpH family outer membrane protein [Desulfatibacillum alkenivorans]SHI61927.1 periplasmic chaperone for outer membrane proteins Skp [Desulfatibacillum alkenivorans DSM 16219]